MWASVTQWVPINPCPVSPPGQSLRRAPANPETCGLKEPVIFIPLITYSVDRYLHVVCFVVGNPKDESVDIFFFLLMPPPPTPLTQAQALGQVQERMSGMGSDSLDNPPTQLRDLVRGHQKGLCRSIRPQEH